MQFARFTVAYWCVLIAALLPFACAWLAKSNGLGKPRKEGGFDNHHPRTWLAQQTDWHARVAGRDEVPFLAWRTTTRSMP